MGLMKEKEVVWGLWRWQHPSPKLGGVSVPAALCNPRGSCVCPLGFLQMKQDLSSQHGDEEKRREKCDEEK